MHIRYDRSAKHDRSIVPSTLVQVPTECNRADGHIEANRGADMDIKGFWKVKEIQTFGDDGLCWKTSQQIIDDPEIDDDAKSLITSRYVFDDDGFFRILSKMPEGATQEQIDSAVAAGKIEVKDGMLVTAKKQWKEENGQLYMNSWIKGELMGQEMPPWEPIAVDGDAIIISVIVGIKLVRE